MSLLKVAGTTATSGQLYVDSVFSTWLYTGNGSTQTITNGIDLSGQGGMTWIKSRSAATDHKLTDTARGATKALISDTTGAQTTDANGLTAFSSTGFSIGTDSVYNTNAATYASWTFRKAAKFFDVVTYTGTGASNPVPHALGSAPAWVIIKSTTSANNWKVYARVGDVSGGYSYALFYGALTGLNFSAGADATGINLSAAITSSSVNVQTLNGGANPRDTNASGVGYVMYLFAHDTSSTGIIQCGSFTTNGTTGAATISLGWEPQFLMLKRTDSTSNWYMADIMRGMPIDSISKALYANLTSAEGNGNTYSPTATGFQIAAGALVAGATYIYMAIRRPNKPPTSGTQVFSPVLNTGNEVTKTVGSTDFPVDLLIAPARTGGSISRWVNDRLRGMLPTLNSSSVDAEFDFSSGYGIGFDQQSGVKVYLSTDNTNVHTYVNYNFKRAPGFFDEVCYTGTGVATTQAHNLTVAPELMIVKERSAANDWWVYNATVGNTKYSVLNSTAIPVTSSTAWNNTTPTSSVFSIGTGANINASTQTYVAYLFATLAGISKVGSYTGNGTTQTINCGFTGGARFVLIKRTDSTGDWYVFDTARGMTTLTDPYLLLNSTAAEVATLGAVTSVTTGFAVNAAIVAAINTNAASYIFLAIA